MIYSKRFIIITVNKKGLGKRFHDDVKVAFSAIKKNPFFQVRYDDVRCLPLKVFPAMIHFTINEKTDTVIIRAIINTHKDPDKNWLKDQTQAKRV